MVNSLKKKVNINQSTLTHSTPSCGTAKFSGGHSNGCYLIVWIVLIASVTLQACLGFKDSTI